MALIRLVALIRLRTDANRRVALFWHRVDGREPGGGTSLAAIRTEGWHQLRGGYPTGGTSCGWHPFRQLPVVSAFETDVPCQPSLASSMGHIRRDSMARNHFDLLATLTTLVLP